MTHRKNIPILAFTLFLFACGQHGTPGDMAASAVGMAVDRVVTEVTITSGSPVAMADLSIEGMSCEMMCGGAIRKAMAKLPGVSTTEIVFNEGDAMDHAIVTYDESQISDAELIEAVRALHDGQYKVLAVSVTKQIKASGSTTQEPARTKQDKGVSVYAPAAALLPSVITLLTRILQH